MPGLKERAKTLVELLDNAAFLFATRPLALDEQASKILDDGGRETLAALSAAACKGSSPGRRGARGRSARLRR